MDGQPELKELFSSVGITESQLQQDKDLSQFLTNFLNARGGIDAVKLDHERVKARPLPVPPPVPSSPPYAPPAPPPYTHQSRPPAPPPSNLFYF